MINRLIFVLKFEKYRGHCTTTTPKRSGFRCIADASPSRRRNSEPHQHLEKFHMVCDLVNLPQVTPEIIKMKLFPHTLRDKASHWLSTLDRELTSWKDIEQAFLRKFYPLGKTQNMRKHIWSFSQRPGETLHETWEKFKDLLRKCPHHAIPKWQLNRIFYDGLLEQHRNMVDSICGGAFMEKTPDEIYSLYENLKNRFQKNQPSQTQPDAMEMMQQMSQMMQQTMNQMMQQMMQHQKQIIEALENKREEGQLPTMDVDCEDDDVYHIPKLKDSSWEDEEFDELRNEKLEKELIQLMGTSENNRFFCVIEDNVIFKLGGEVFIINLCCRTIKNMCLHFIQLRTATKKIKIK
ncbi:unnamed protein product [Spirodela intermedia]|uniref:Retrotransposon gag domain-containing protein n=1 Tax=Spirodela intermedia TaxID=51605 RepID=A0ABN7ECP2_SPIIN|nr:unnamed protein product [Spirodela intermedia]